MALCLSKPGSEHFFQSLTVKWCQCCILNCAILRNVSPDFFQTRFRDSQKVWCSGHSTTLIEMHRPGSRAGWLLASLDSQILVWPAKDDGKISRVPIHTSKTRSDCCFKRVGIFFPQIVLYFPCEGGSYYEHSWISRWGKFLLQVLLDLTITNSIHTSSLFLDCHFCVPLLFNQR